jgi:hypothetical protein
MRQRGKDRKNIKLRKEENGCKKDK